MSTTADTLTHLHDHYVEAVNIAVAEGDDMPASSGWPPSSTSRPSTSSASRLAA